MLVIRKEQMEVFQEVAVKRFEESVIIHLKTYFPKNCDLLGEEQIRIFVNYGISWGEKEGFTTERDLILYINLMLLLGSHFSKDPQLSKITIAFTDTSYRDIGQRINRVYDLAMDYLNRIAGADNVYWERVLHNLKLTPIESLLNSIGTDFEGDMLKLFEQIYPEKYLAVGSHALSRLIALGLEHCQTMGFKNRRRQAFYIGLMYICGCGFMKDPQFPWGSEALDNAKTESEAEIFRKLYHQSMACLNNWSS